MSPYIVIVKVLGIGVAVINNTSQLLPPLSDNLLAKIFGEEIRQLKFFNFKYYEFKGKKYFIARSGWSKQSGFEIYVEGFSYGQPMWDELFKLGKDLDVRAGCPNLIERIESALLSYGNDIDNNDNPLECGLDKYVNLDSAVNFLGKEKLKEVKQTGVSRKLMGVIIDTKEISVSKSMDLIDDKGSKIGELRSGVYSPHFKKVIGIAMLDKPYYEVSQEFKISVNDSTFEGKVCDLPFI